MNDDNSQVKLGSATSYDKLVLVVDETNEKSSSLQSFLQHPTKRARMVCATSGEYRLKLNNQSFDLLALYDLEFSIVNTILSEVHRSFPQLPIVIFTSKSFFKSETLLGINTHKCSIPISSQALEQTWGKIFQGEKKTNQHHREGSAVQIKPTDTIFVVDDDEISLELLNDQLSDFAKSVKCFSCGADYLKAIRQEKPKMVVLDYHLPDFNGEDLVFWTRRLFSSSSLPIIIVSAQESKDVVVRLTKHKVSDYLVKPVNPDRLKEIVSGHLSYFSSSHDNE
jgi:DNA-binding NtrC family response regulator